MAEESKHELQEINSKTAYYLRHKILRAAECLFRKSGYENVTARAIAQAAGCSQMAMYRHFPDKESLFRHLCTELYQRFTTRLHAKYDDIPDPKERLRHALREFVVLSLKNPHHYQLAFLNPGEGKRRTLISEDVSAAAISYFRQNLKMCFRKDTTDDLIDERLHQILAVLHGMTVMLITRPKDYGLTKQAGLTQLESAFELLISLQNGNSRSVRR